MLDITRHQSVFAPRQCEHPITVIGAGATGSRLFMALIELGLTDITVIDFDTVEQHNLANQAFLHHHTGTTKISALENLVRMKLGEVPSGLKFLNTRIHTKEHAEHIQGIVFLLTDTMSSRREIFENCIDGNSSVAHVFETRMASSYGNIMHFNPQSTSERERWLSTLIDDNNAEVSPCGGSISVGCTASLIANLAVWQFMLYCTDAGLMADNTEVFFAPLCIFKMENQYA